MMLQFFARMLAAVAAVAVFGCPAQADNLVVNGDFSNGATNSNFALGGYGAIPNWNFAGTNGSTSEGVNGPNSSPGYFGPTNQTTDNTGNGITNFAFIQLQSNTGEVTLAFTVDNLNDNPDVSIDFTNVDVAVAPEPSSYLMFLAGGALLVLLARSRFTRRA